VPWRLICDRLWISLEQMPFANQRLDEIGRTAGGWLKQIERRTASKRQARGRSGRPVDWAGSKAGAPDDDGPRLSRTLPVKGSRYRPRPAAASFPPRGRGGQG
jgi:hypothetical protein